MSNLREAAQRALEALEHVTESETFYRDPRGDRAGPAIDALHAALAKPDDKAQSVACVGWKMVPLEPTEEMLAAGVVGSDAYGVTMGDARGCYAAMLAAAPQPPAEQDLIQVTRKDGNDFCRIVAILGMEEEGDVVAEVQRLFDANNGAELSDEQHHSLDTAEMVCFYEQDFYVLSNFSSFTLKWNSVERMRFDTSEAAYHWEKFPGHDDIRIAIINAPSAHEAFKIAERNKIHRRPDWDDVKVDIMREILRAKARQHEYVRRKLLATGDRELVENSWRDDFWGWGPNRDGQNMLGKLWMEVRSELRAIIAADRTAREGKA